MVSSSLPLFVVLRKADFSAFMLWYLKTRFLPTLGRTMGSIIALYFLYSYSLPSHFHHYFHWCFAVGKDLTGCASAMHSPFLPYTVFLRLSLSTPGITPDIKTIATATTSPMPRLHIVPVLAHAVALTSRLGLHFPKFPPLYSTPPLTPTTTTAGLHTPLENPQP